MIKQTFSEIVTDELIKDAILNNEFPGFMQDYLVLHCLLRKYKPQTVFEIGTNFGTGTNIICNAVPDAKVYTLELPSGLGDKPLTASGKDMTGVNCKFPFYQLRGDSTKFDYFHCDFFYIDAEHIYENVLAETKAVLETTPFIVCYHDSDIPEVMRAIQDGMTANYDLYVVEGTRISYLKLQ